MGVFQSVKISTARRCEVMGESLRSGEGGKQLTEMSRTSGGNLADCSVPVHQLRQCWSTAALSSSLQGRSCRLFGERILSCSWPRLVYDSRLFKKSLSSQHYLVWILSPKTWILKICFLEHLRSDGFFRFLRLDAVKLRLVVKAPLRCFQIQDRILWMGKDINLSHVSLEKAEASSVPASPVKAGATYRSTLATMNWYEIKGCTDEFGCICNFSFSDVHVGRYWVCRLIISSSADIEQKSTDIEQNSTDIRWKSTDIDQTSTGMEDRTQSLIPTMAPLIHPLHAVTSRRRPLSNDPGMTQTLVSQLHTDVSPPPPPPHSLRSSLGRLSSRQQLRIRGIPIPSFHSLLLAQPSPRCPAYINSSIVIGAEYYVQRILSLLSVIVR
ncbi:hypothetical protein J6590_010757 [Homalodisca vitripennis]|nr:hypothetical protein J6590_010757 [Homalodisca vitripennis]